jgi:hypothetical protein
MKRICVNCGSSPGARLEYRDAARHLGRVLVKRGLGLVYGGAEVGLMGELANAVLARGGEVIGIIPDSIADKVAHPRLTELRVVRSMHERKQRMFDLSDGFIALPGGLGTLDEFIELLTWGQLGMHSKPCGLLNVCGYFDGFLEFLDHAVEQRFVHAAHRRMVIVRERPEALLEAFEGYEAPRVEKWLDRET